MSERQLHLPDAPLCCWVLTEDEGFLAAAAEGLASESLSVRELHPGELRHGILRSGDTLLLDWREVTSAEKALGLLCDELSLREPAGIAIAASGVGVLLDAPLLEVWHTLPEWRRVAASLTRVAGLRARLLRLEDERDAQALHRNAEVEMRQVERSGGNPAPAYTASMGAAVRHESPIEMGLRGAIEGGELELYFQPRYRARTGRLTGAEALLRWNSPSLGQVCPSDFIPIAEDVGLIAPLGDWVMHELCRCVRQWEDVGEALRFSFNVSALQLLAPELPENLLAALAATGVSPRHIELEVTESVAIHYVPGVVEILSRLQRTGVQIALDDFGTGYSSFSVLIDLPLDTLKLDRSIISGLGTNPDAARVTGAIIGMAHSLGLAVVAEGVEDDTQLNILRNLECDEVQGFYYSRPLPAEEFERLAREALV